MTTLLNIGKSIHVTGEPTNPVVASLAIPQFQLTFRLSPIDAEVLPIGLYVPPFYKTVELCAYNLQFVPEVLFRRNYCIPQIIPAATFKTCWSVSTSLNIGRTFLLFIPLGLEKYTICNNRLSVGLHNDVALKSTLSSGSIFPGWAIKTEMEQTSAIQADWLIKNSIGRDDLSGNSELFDGPVIHSAGSHGGYE